MDTGIRSILLIDDTVTDRVLIERALRSCSPVGLALEIHGVESAAAALEAAEQKTYSAIILDHSLPGANGLDLLRALRARAVDTPIVMITGTGDEELVVAALREGASAYVVKRIGFELALPDAVDRIVRTAARAHADAAAHSALAARVETLEKQLDDERARCIQARRQTAGLANANRAAASIDDPQALLDLITRTAGELSGAHAAALLIDGEGETVLVSLWGAIRRPPGFRSQTLRASLDATVRSHVAVDVSTRRRRFGILWVGHATEQRPGSPVEADVLEALAALAGSALAAVPAARRTATATSSETGDGGVAPGDPVVDDAARSPSPPGEIEPERTRRFLPSALPPFSPALAQLLRLIDADADADAVAHALATDAMLSATALRSASTAALGRARRVETLRDAVMVVGMRGMRNVVVARFARTLLNGEEAVDEMLWEQALGAGVAAQLVAERRVPGSGDDAYLAALLCNVGAVALRRAHPARYGSVILAAVTESRALADLEREAFGVSSAELTADIARGWQLPAAIQRQLDARSEARGIDGALLAWAALQALDGSPAWRELLGGRASPDWLVTELARRAGELGLGPADLVSVAERVATHRETVRQLLCEDAADERSQPTGAGSGHGADGM